MRCETQTQAPAVNMAHNIFMGSLKRQGIKYPVRNSLEWCSEFASDGQRIRGAAFDFRDQDDAGTICVHVSLRSGDVIITEANDAASKTDTARFTDFASAAAKLKETLATRQNLNGIKWLQELLEKQL